MEQFRTVVSVPIFRRPINLKQPILTLGSCFSDAIGIRLQQAKFTTMVNPFGTIYNPVSIHKLLHYAINDETAPPHTYLQQADIHLNYDFHSCFSALTKQELQEQIRLKLSECHRFLQTSEWLMITYGTAWVYEHVETGDIVANCHKVPARVFQKKLLRIDDIVKSFESLYVSIRRYYPALRIIMTVSPVRHIKESLPLNNVSKSALRLACHAIMEKFPDVEYFPAYEIMTDDLRDYRFYKTDMIHPTEQAEDYIWERFQESTFDESTKKFVIEWKSIQTALRHRPFHRSSSGHQNFLKQIILKLEQIQDRVNVDAEVTALKKQLNTKIEN